MPIRLSGLNSGLDTDAIVQELVKAYSTKKDNLVKAQTKLGWKQDAWKEMNSKIYSFYSKNLSKMRFSDTYNLKSASILNANIAKVSASSNAVNGTQSLKVKQLSESGYLTGGVMKGKVKDGETEAAALKGSSKLKEIAGIDFKGGEAMLNLKVNGENKTFNITEETTINEFVVALKEAGINANFDEKNQRLFIMSKDSGEKNDFSLTADNAAGLNALQSLGVYTVNDTDKAEYERWANYSDEEIAKRKEELFEKNKYTPERLLEIYKNDTKAATDAIADLTKENKELDKKVTDLFKEKDNDTLVQEDRDAIDKKIEELNKKIDKNSQAIEKHQAVIDDRAQYLPSSTDTGLETATKEANVQAKVDELNEKVKAQQDALVDSRVAMARDIVTNGAAESDGAVRKVGKDSIIELNGATFTSNSNNYEINGLTIQATAVSEKDAKGEFVDTSITVGTDVDSIYDMIKGFFTSYNELIIGMDKAYNAANAKGYEPLTDEEKEAMSESEIDKWETKIKDSLLRRDNTLGGIADMMKTAMLRTYKVNGKSYSLSSFGINTLGYYKSPENEKGAYHIDGDAKDAYTAGNADKLKAAIANDPDAVVGFFTQMTNDFYDGMTTKMKSTTMRSVYTVYNDKKMKKDYDEYKDKIKTWEEKLKTMEESYYSKFTAMEKALANLQASTSSLTSMFGGK